MPERDKSKIQGEGDYEGARRYRRGVEQYVKTADIDRAAHDAQPAMQRGPRARGGRGHREIARQGRQTAGQGRQGSGQGIPRPALKLKKTR
jgi:hypothetical protein